ncbi:hypothetical protein [Natronospira bacteriovora]|uniref:DUF4760 domain-containing protein n=1 Tax=Natronospira bacteriovora TaxID=3069753 RepID=A0ABU0W7B6_9GAMM|nr:hypothetical protein [Natronospira sp. AB-CW4]MDQ2069924.1 hypothetical protein [Natronospira sp. AB-CW4]
MDSHNTPASTKDWIFLGIGVLLIAFLVYAAFSFARLLFGFLGNVDPTVGAALIAGMFTVLVGIGSTLVTQYIIKVRQAEEAHREAKISLYKQCLELAAAHLAEDNPNVQGKKLSDKGVANEYFHFKTELLLRGSPKVIQALENFEDVTSEGGDSIRAVDDIYREIRRDIGLTNKGLRPKELAGIYVKNSDRKEWFR